MGQQVPESGVAGGRNGLTQRRRLARGQVFGHDDGLAFLCVEQGSSGLGRLEGLGQLTAHEEAQLPVALRQCLGRLQPLGDVARDADKSVRAPLWIVDQG